MFATNNKKIIYSYWSVEIKVLYYTLKREWIFDEIAHIYNNHEY